MEAVEKHVFFELYNSGRKIGCFDCYVHGDTESAAWEEAGTLGFGMQYGISALRRYKTKCSLFVYEDGHREQPRYKLDANYRNECAFHENTQPCERFHDEIAFR